MEPLRRILERSGVFTEEEIGVAVEIMEFVSNDAKQQDYEIYTAVDVATVAGFVCFGPTPLTKGTFDLYWIAVDPSRQHQKIGKQLMLYAEEKLKSHNARLVLVETSSQLTYENTRKFYFGLRYQELSRIREYYKPGDDLVVYGKYL